MNILTFTIFIIALVSIQNSLAATINTTSSYDECRDNVGDVVFILDSSASIYPPDFDKQIAFVESIVDRFNIGPTQIRVGVETFGETNWLKFHLDRYSDKASLKQAVKAVRFRSGKWTNTGAALKYATETMFTEKHGDRRGITNIAVVITDGKSTEPKITKAAAEAARAAGIQIFAIGVGKRYDRRELEDIASDPSSKFVFTVDNYKALDSILESFTSTTCSLIRKLTTPSKPTTSTSTTTTKKTTTTIVTTNINDTFIRSNRVDSRSRIDPTHRLEITHREGANHRVEISHSGDPNHRVELIHRKPDPTPTPQVNITYRPEPTHRMAITHRQQVRGIEVTNIPQPPRRMEIARRPQPPRRVFPSRQHESTVLDVCGDKPADIYFVMDSSRSIGPGNYEKQKEFVKRLVGAFDLGVNKTRIGVVSYSNSYRMDIPLGSTANLQQLRAAIDNVPYHAKGTNTGDAINFVRTVGFSEGMARRNVAHVMIILTDGLSRHPARTAQEASLAHDAGIYTFAIGIGRGVDKGELSSIASNPDSEFMFYVDGFDALHSIRDLLATRTCQKLPRDEPTKLLATLPPSQFTDILFVYDVYGIGARKASMIHEFILNVLSSLDLQSGYVRVGRLVETCPDINLVSLGGLDALSSMTSSFHYPGITDLIGQLDTYVVTQGGRPDTKTTAVVFLDEDEHDITRTVRQIQNLRNMNVLTIIIGDEEKYKVPSTEDKQYVTLPDYKQLPDYQYSFQNDACFCGQN